MPYRHLWTTTNLLLFGIWFSIGLVIVLRTVLSTDGMTSGDGTYYLEAAQNILIHHQFRITTLGLGEPLPLDGYDPFTLWPIGYPVLIAGISFLTGLPVFWASKLLGWLLAGLSIGGFRRLAGEDAAIMSAMMLFSAPLLLFSSTFSEAAFLTTLVWFVHWLHQFRQTGENRALQGILICALFLFLLRYVGIFSGVVLLWLGWRTISENGQKTVPLAVVIFLWTSIIFVYAFWNYARSGAFSGMNRYAGITPEVAQIIGSWLKGFMVGFFPLAIDRVSDSLLSLLICIQVVIFVWVWLAKNKQVDPAQTSSNDRQERLSLAQVLFVTGLCYLVVMTASRWQHVLWLQKNSFYMELFAPVFWLWIPAIILWIRHQLGWQTQLKKAVWLTAGTSFMVYGPLWAVKQVYEQRLPYHQAVAKAIDATKDIPPGSIVLFGDSHLNYLRPDLIRLEPPSKPLVAKPPTFEETINRLHQAYPTRPFYVFMNTRFNDMNPDGLVTEEWFHSSFIRRSQSLPPNTRIRIH
ncbi:MAG TPA: hypothetical protein DIW24_00385 [Bacteroidetes bacterium]|nr:hypothetical protein [Bacteroidota bacterium]HRR08020.1 hypothetical protein [Rhodothermales bacterium]